MLEWSSEHAVDDAHTDPEVLAVWERKAQLADYLPPAALAGAGVPIRMLGPPLRPLTNWVVHEPLGFIGSRPP